MNGLSAPQGSVLAVCVVAELRPTRATLGVTGHHKRPVTGPTKVHPLGVRGDVQVDRKNHGGPDKAVYVYAQEAADAWAAELGRPIEPGMFGENLRTAGLPVDDAVLGEHWQVGTPGVGPVLEVSMPRTPCQTFADYLGEPGWVRRFTERGLVGAYCRVIRTGAVAAGDEVTRVRRPEHGVTIRRWFTRQDPADARLLLEAEAAGEFVIPEALRDYVDRSLTRDSA